MLRSILTNTKYFLITSSIALGTAYGYCYWRCAKNQKQYLQAINADTLKDASRLTNQSFGISWGFQADDTVMNSIDSGDLFFIKYDCLQTLSPLEMVKCYRLTIPLLDEEYHGIGLAYRDENGLMVYENEFGVTKLMRYSQLVSLPYIKELMVQKTKQNVHNKLVKLLEEDKMFDEQQYISNNNNNNNLKTNNITQTSPQSFNPTQPTHPTHPTHSTHSPSTHPSIFQTLLQILTPRQNSFTFINRVLKRLGLLQPQQQVIDLRQLLANEKQVNIRTQTNKMLRSL